VRRDQPRVFNDERLERRANDVHIPQRCESQAAPAKALSPWILDQLHECAKPLQAFSQRVNIRFTERM